MPAARLLRTLKAWLRRKPQLPRELQAGKEVVDAIEKVKTGRSGGHGDVPVEDVLIQRATVLD